MNYTVRNLAIAAMLMLIGIVAVTSFIRGERRDLSRGKQEVKIYVAAKEIPAGTPADELEDGGYLSTIEILREDAPTTAVSSLDDLAKLVSNETVYEGEFLPRTAFDKNSGLAPTHQIKGNERLFAAPINASSDAAGLIRAGDRVDMFASFQVEGNGTQSQVVARDVEVIETPDTLVPESVEVEAAAPEAEGDTKLYVFKATDEEAQNIKYAIDQAISNGGTGGLMMTLRPSNGDTETVLRPLTKPDPSIR